MRAAAAPLLERHEASRARSSSAVQALPDAAWL